MTKSMIVSGRGMTVGGAVSVLICTIAFAGCGGVAKNDAAGAGASRGDGSGANGAGAGSSRGGASGTGARASTTNGAGANGASTTGANIDGGPGSGNGGGNGSSGSANAGGSGVNGADASIPDPPRTTDQLGELDQLHMDQPLSSIVTDPCPTSFMLNLDRDRDGTIEATEARYFDARGRLVASELAATSDDAGVPPRKRVRISYDDQGRPSQYLYGLEGSAALQPWIEACSAPVAGLPRGTVVDIDYGPGGLTTVHSTSTENCSDELEPICENLVFDGHGQFLARRRGCDGANGQFFARMDQSRKVDAQDRSVLDTISVPPRTQTLWGSDIRYSYPTENQQVLSWNGNLNSTCCGGPPHTLTRTLDPDERITRVTYGDSDTVTYDYDPDGCGVTESTDLWNDGVTDLITITSCTGGRVTHQEERNMVSTEDIQMVDRSVTPLEASAQSSVSIDIHYSASGRITERTFQVTTLQTRYDIARTQHEVFRDDGGGKSSGDLDRSFDDEDAANGGRDETYVLRPESSTSSCVVERACSTTGNVLDDGDRCEAGLGINVIPSPYLEVPGTPTTDLTRGFPWAPMPATFIDNIPLIDDVVGF